MHSVGSELTSLGAAQGAMPVVRLTLKQSCKAFK